MPRISSKKTRQAILATGEAIDPNTAEYLVLFDSDGNPVTATLSPRGEWTAFSAYTVNSVVTYEGSSYRAKNPIEASVDGTNQNPASNITDWEVLALRGSPGIVWRGDYDPDETYVEGDAVFFNGSAFYATKVLSGIEPSIEPDEDTRQPPLGSSLATHSLGSYRPMPRWPDFITLGFGDYSFFEVGEAGDIQFTGPTIRVWQANGSGPFIVAGGTYHFEPGVYFYTDGGGTNEMIPLDAVLQDGTETTWEVLAQGNPENWRGEFNPALEYALGDLVLYDNSTYRATDNMPAGSAPIPGASGLSHYGDGPTGGTQYVYSVPLGEMVEGPLPNGAAGLGVPGVNSTWLRFVGKPGSILHIETDANTFAVASNGSHNIFTGQSSGGFVVGNRDIWFPSDGILFLETGKGSSSLDPFTLVATGDAEGAANWLLVALGGQDGEDGAPGADGADGPQGEGFNFQGTWTAIAFAERDVVEYANALWIANAATAGSDEPGVSALWDMILEGVEGPQGTAGVGSGGYGLPAGGVADDIPIKQSSTDGDVAWGPIPSSGIVPQTLASLAEQGPSPTGDVGFGPTFNFDVGPSGMVLIHFSWEWRQPPGSVGLNVLLDGALICPNNLGVGNSNYQRFDLWVAGIWSPGAYTQDTMKAGIPGVMLFLAEGAHTLRLALRSNGSGGGYGQRFRFAALPL